MKKLLLYLLGVSLLAAACTQEADNPFEPTREEEQTENPDGTLNPVSLAGLHRNIFRKTCANSGCHDGTFEPDFRTISSTYNTLVYHPIIKNDPQEAFEFRVVPGNVNQSLLIARLTYDIDGNSGMMPLITEPDSDWPEKREEYIDNIKTWISNGAKEHE